MSRADMSRIDFASIHRSALARLDDVLGRFLPGGTRQGHEYTALNPTRGDSTAGSFKVNVNSGVWSDFATGDRGKDLISLVAYVNGFQQLEAGRTLANFLSIEASLAPSKAEKSSKDKVPSRVVAEFRFHHANGAEAYCKARLEPGWNGERKSFYFYRILNGKKTKGGGGLHLLYRLPEVIKSETVIICEGEKKADTVAAMGLCGTSLDTGSKSKLSPEMLRHLKGRLVVVLIDNDNPGREYGEYLARTIHGTAKSIKVILLPGLLDKGDVVDWQRIPDNDGAKLRQIIAAAPPWRPTTQETGADETTDETPAKRMKRAESAELLLSLAMELPLFVDNEASVYTLSAEHQMLRVENTESLLTWRFHEIAGGYPSADSLKGVIRLLIAKGRAQGEKVTLFTRIGTHEDAIVLDLLGGRCAKITPDGVTVAQPPPMFRTFPHQQALPDPDLNGDPWRFLDFCQVAQNQRLVVLVALIASFVPGIENPLMMVHGPPGSAKSTFCLFFKLICDPSSVKFQGLDDVDLKDFYAMLREQWIYLADNVSKLSNKMSDMLCRIVSGDTVSQRLMYTNTETVQLQIKNLVLLNGIPSLLHRSDLNDRAIAVRLERIPNKERRGKNELYAEFNAAIPEILGGCLRTLSKAMKIERELGDFTSYVRLHDFSKWGYCIAEALGGYGEQFLNDLKRDAQRQTDELAENNLLVTTLIDSLGSYGPKWESQVSTVYSILMEKTGLDKKDLLRDPTFPHKIQDLRRHLDRLRPVLDELGITYRYGLRSKYGTPVTFIQTAPEEQDNPEPPTEVADAWQDSDFEEVAAP